MTVPDEAFVTPDEGPLVSYEALAALLLLTNLRNQFRVGLALAQRFPDDDSWDQFGRDPEVLDSFNELGHIIDDIRAEALTDEIDVTPESVSQAVANHYDRAMEVVEPIAESLGVEPSELLSVLVNA